MPSSISHLPSPARGTGHHPVDILRFNTCGSVDDGKSTLIGRLLFDSKLIFEDHLSALAKDSKKHGTTGEDIDLALLVSFVVTYIDVQAHGWAQPSHDVYTMLGFWVVFTAIDLLAATIALAVPLASAQLS